MPSNACGGFHLKVANKEPHDVTVIINGTYRVTVAAGSSETIVEFLPPEQPLMPWTVVVTSSTGSEIGTSSSPGR